MANTINIPKTHLILGLSLPVAVLIGYVLAEPMEMGSMAVVLGVFAVLCIPLLMRWYHPLLIVSWNSAISPVVFPGRAGLWMVMAFLGLTIAMLNPDHPVVVAMGRRHSRNGFSDRRIWRRQPGLGTIRRRQIR